MIVRRSTAVLAAAVLGAAVPATAVLAAAVPAVAAPSPSPSASAKLPDGLYGTGDPTYDGVWRQSLALVAQTGQGVTPAAQAVDWLAGQQCADGGFASYRPDPATACDAKTMRDSNSTAVAVQALTATGGHDEAADKAVGWLKSVQNEDGGWGYTPGGPSDANSTSVVVGALAAAGEQPGKVLKGGKSPYDALLALALPCKGKDAGAFAYQPGEDGELAANADATAASVLGALGAAMTAEPAGGEQASASCAAPGDREQAAHNGASWLVGALAKDQHLTSALPGSEDQPDYGNTADAVVALAVAGFGEQAGASARWLESNALAWAGQSGPAAYAQLVLAAQASGLDPRDFGGKDLVSLLGATGPAPERTADSAGDAKDAKDTKAARAAEDEDDNDGVAVWWIVGVGLVGGIGVGLLISARRKNRP